MPVVVNPILQISSVNIPPPLPTSRAVLPFGSMPRVLRILLEYPTLHGLIDVFSKCKMLVGCHHISPSALYRLLSILLYTSGLIFSMLVGFWVFYRHDLGI